MLRLLATRRWMTWLLVAALWSTLCVFAGLWQWHRWESKSAVQSRMDRNYDAAPLPISSALHDGRAPGVEEQWRQVSGTGRYVGPTIMVRNRPGPGGDFGYEVLNILHVDDVEVLVDRGWVANGSSAATPASVPAAPSGAVTVTGWIRPSERDLKRPAVAGQLSSISVAEAERTTHRNLVDGYVTMRSEKSADGSTPARPQAQDKPSQGMAAGINLSYALQWWLGIVASFAFVLLRARREHLDAVAAAREGDENAPEVGGEPDTTPSSLGSTAPKAPRRKKQRIWDDEDE